MRLLDSYQPTTVVSNCVATEWSTLFLLLIASQSNSKLLVPQKVRQVLKGVRFNREVTGALPGDTAILNAKSEHNSKSVLDTGDFALSSGGRVKIQRKAHHIST